MYENLFMTGSGRDPHLFPADSFQEASALGAHTATHAAKEGADAATYMQTLADLLRDNAQFDREQERLASAAEAEREARALEAERIARLRDQEYQRRGREVSGSLSRFWNAHDAMRPSSILAHQTALELYDELSPTNTNFAFALGGSPDLSPGEAAANVAAASLLGQPLAEAMVPRHHLQVNLQNARDYLLHNLALLRMPRGIFNVSNVYLQREFGISHAELNEYGLLAGIPQIRGEHSILAVLAADTLHNGSAGPATTGAVPLITGEQYRYIRDEIIKTARDRYGYQPPKGPGTPKELHVIAECIVADTHDYRNTSPRRLRALAARMHTIAGRHGVTTSRGLPRQAAATFDALMAHYKEHRWDDAKRIGEALVALPGRAALYFGFREDPDEAKA